MVARPVPITPSVLSWAVQESGHGIAQLASSTGVDANTFNDWIEGRAQPGVTQFRKLAALLRRPTATFLLPAPPAIAPPAVEFRHAPGAAARSYTPTERVRLREAQRLQRGLRWLASELREDELALPRFSAPRDNVEETAATLRQLLGVSVEEQLRWASESMAFRTWRQTLERRGVAVLALPMGANSARGFSLWDATVPIVAINTHWNNHARIFTLFHEFAHLVTRTNSLCDEPSGATHKHAGDDVERWCEEVASAFLLPWGAVAKQLRTRYGWDGQTKISNLAVPSSLARRFRVSVRATVLRLITKGAAGWSLYAKIAPASDQKPGGGGGSGRTRAEARIDEYGSRTASLFRRGLEREVLERDNVLNYVNVGDRELETFMSPATQ